MRDAAHEQRRREPAVGIDSRPGAGSKGNRSEKAGRIPNSLKEERLVEAVVAQLTPLLKSQVPEGLGSLTSALVQSNAKLDQLTELFGAARARAEEQAEDVALMREIVSLLKQNRDEPPKI